jgi:hypothetical protein
MKRKYRERNRVFDGDILTIFEYECDEDDNIVSERVTRKNGIHEIAKVERSRNVYPPKRLFKKPKKDKYNRFVKVKRI